MSTAATSRSAGRIGVLEAVPFFAPELQRQFEGDEIEVRSFRLMNDLVDMPGPRVCVLSTGIEQDAIARFLWNSHREPATACVVISPDDHNTGWEWAFREFGAVSVIDASVRGDALAAICRKLLNTRSMRLHRRESHV